jgi:hypothetical protein
MPDRDPELNVRHDAVIATALDVESGLGPFFEATDGFSVPTQFGMEPPITNGQMTAVVWQYAGRHSAEFQGVPATDRVVTIRGTTVVDHSGPEPLFHRYVDWLDVMAQLGLTANMRPASG